MSPYPFFRKLYRLRYVLFIRFAFLDACLWAVKLDLSSMIDTPECNWRISKLPLCLIVLSGWTKTNFLKCARAATLWHTYRLLPKMIMSSGSHKEQVLEQRHCDIRTDCFRRWSWAVDHTRNSSVKSSGKPLIRSFTCVSTTFLKYSTLFKSIAPVPNARLAPVNTRVLHVPSAMSSVFLSFVP